MGFKPSQATTTSKKKNPEDFKYGEIKYPVPEEGSRPARLSFIVDLGVQEREDFEDKKTGEIKPQQPVHQVALLADLTKDVVDYGGDIGEAPYRLALYSSFTQRGQKPKVKGVAFTQVPPTSGDVWTFHPNSLITKLAKATDTREVIEGYPIKDQVEFDKKCKKLEEAGLEAELEAEVTEWNDNSPLNDVELLLGKPFNATVEVNRRTVGDKTYENVRFKGASPIPDMSEYGVSEEQYCPPLSLEPRLITFDDCTEDDVKFIRYDLKCTIVRALNYEGSNIQKVFQKLGIEAGLLGEQEKPTKVVEKEPTPEPEPIKEDKPSGSKKKIPFVK